MNYFNFFNLNIRLTSYKDFLNSMILKEKDTKGDFVCFLNVHMLVESIRDKEFRQQLNLSRFIVTDGVPIAKSLKFLHQIDQDRIAGMDVLSDVLLLASSNKKSVYFFGSTRDTLGLLAQNIKVNYPELKVAGFCSPPFSEILDSDEYIRKINEVNPDFVFVILGCPKQEKWMAKHHTKISSTLLGIGGALPVYLGLQKRAPKWMQISGLEWLYRLFQEPRRLWKRYLFTNTYFVLMVAFYALTRRTTLSKS
jgi:N-acetylglucosaminyldiphosphoundecaprenol N-acetyl-beta-D-mannosaminyltransferase